MWASWPRERCTEVILRSLPVQTSLGLHEQGRDAAGCGQESRAGSAGGWAVPREPRAHPTGTQRLSPSLCVNPGTQSPPCTGTFSLSPSLPHPGTQSSPCPTGTQSLSPSLCPSLCPNPGTQSPPCPSAAGTSDWSWRQHWPRVLA